METDRSQRDWGANPTVLDGRKEGSVVTAQSLLGWNTVDGFVMTNGLAVRGGGSTARHRRPSSRTLLLSATKAVLAGTIKGVGASTAAAPAFTAGISWRR